MFGALLPVGSGQPQSDDDEREEQARPPPIEAAHAHFAKIAEAMGPTARLLPRGGCGAWDRPGNDLREPEALIGFFSALRSCTPGSVEVHDVEVNINDEAFVDTALAGVDTWCADGCVASPGVRQGEVRQ